MMPAGYAGLESQLLLWLVAMIRPGAAFLAAPIFGASAVPVQLRLVLALGVGIPAASMIGIMLPAEGLVSFSGVLFIMGEVLLGLALGFAVQIGFASAQLGGEAISNAMGLGFASMNDPTTGHSSAALGQFLSMLATFLFLATGGHLVFVGIIVESYRSLPPGAAWLTADATGSMIRFGGLVFASGLAIALPVGFAMVIVQIIMGVIARSTPTLNLFAVGMPAALLAGIILLAMATPAMADSLMAAIGAGLDQAEFIAAPAHG
jgi:flagellar biosynthetic protein FliR